MSPKDVIKMYPNLAELGRLIGNTGSCIGMWKIRGKVPPVAQLRLNRLSNGALRISPDAQKTLQRLGLMEVAK